jgi:hypothetical protein
MRSAGRAIVRGVTAYTKIQLLDLLHLTARNFERLRKQGRLPFVEQIHPQISSHTKLFRADLVDRYLAGEWGQPRHFTAHKRTRRRAAAAGALVGTP